MTDLLDHAVKAARTLPPDMQDAIAREMLAYAGFDDEVIALTPEEEASLAESLSQAACGEFATDERVQAIWAKYGL